MKKLFAIALSVMMLFSMISFAAAEGDTYKIGLCNLVDDPSLNQIYNNIVSQLEAIAAEKNVSIEIIGKNCMFDMLVLDQIIDDFIADDVDLMIGIATPVAKAMKTKTEDKQIPVVFAAVSDPVGSDPESAIVDSMEVPGGNLTGTSDSLNTDGMFDLIFSFVPEVKTVALLYNPSEDSSTAPIASAKALLTDKGVAYKEYGGKDTAEIQMAVESLIADEVDAVFTPTDNTIQVAEPAIVEALNEAKIPHFAGADSFALVGAFVGFGVDYAYLGRVTADMAADILLNGADPATLPVRTFNNGKVAINLDACEALGVAFDDIAAQFGALESVTLVEALETAEEFAE